TVRQTWSGRNDVAWERSWAALKSQGYLIRIAVRVAADEPDIVQLLIGNTVVFKEVPDWISRRREGEPPDHADRARFGKKLFAALGRAQEQGPWLGRPLPERMAYSLTKQGRSRSDPIADASTRYMGPAPVSMAEYKAVLAEAAKPGTLDLVKVSLALSGIELAPGVMEAVRAAVNSRSSIFIYGAPGNGKTTLARRIPSL